MEAAHHAWQQDTTGQYLAHTNRPDSYWLSVIKAFLLCRRVRAANQQSQKPH